MRVRIKSLVTRLFAHFLLLSLTFATVAGLLTFLGARSALRQSVVDRLSVFAALEEDQLRRWITSQREEVVHLASLPEIQALAATLLAGGGGNDGGSAEHRLRRILESTLEIHQSLQEILLLSAVGGRIVLSTDREHEGQYRVRDSFFTRGQRGTFVQNVYPSPIELEPALTVSTPLQTDDGELLGVLAVHLDLDELDQIIQSRTGLGETGETYLVDKYNVFVSGTRFGREKYPRGVHTEGIDAALEGEDGSGLYRNYGGVPVIGVYRWLDDLDLALLVEVAQEEAFAPARRIVLVILAVGLVLAALLAVGTVVLARQIARPVLKITDTAVRVAEGDLAARAPVVTEDEIGVLAGTFNDMTERLQQVDGELREEIADRKQAQDDLEAKNAELEQFTYTVSHDLKSPLVTIQGFIGLLEKDADTGDVERVRHYLDRIRDAAGKLGRLLDELLELSRIGRIANPPEDVDLKDLVDEVLELLSGQIEKRGVEVVVADELPAVHVDRFRLLEVIQNLIDNALKFLGDQPAPRIEVGARRDAGEAGPVVFVRDNGIGIARRYHDRVFRLFERLDQAIDGTGVGLALVKRIVEAHGGRIWIESREGVPGTTFCFTLADHA
jgi:signal transduction histidine kinase